MLKCSESKTAMRLNRAQQDWTPVQLLELIRPTENLTKNANQS